MKAIHTRYLGPTNFRGSRIVATEEGGGRVIVGYKSELSSEQNHRETAEALRDKLGWKGELIGGSLLNGYAWVFLEPDVLIDYAIATASENEGLAVVKRPRVEG